MEPQSDKVGAYVPGPRTVLAPTASGPLDDLAFAAKDLFDVAGVVTTGGNPDWARSHPPAAATAPVIAALLAAGARMSGKTKTVELAFGITGENPHHGTPRNPRVPGRFPGGSSCGSVAAVASGDVPFALGSDTGGSVRIPASYTGLYGLRPTQGAISLAATLPLAPSLDTPGWFTRDAALLERVGAVLLPGEHGRFAGPLLAVREIWDNAEPATAAALRPALDRLAPLFGPVLEVSLAPEGIAALYQAYRALSGAEAWASHGAWITEAKPDLSAPVARRFDVARQISAAEVASGWVLRQVMQARLRPLLAGGAVLVYPTSPGPAPELAAPAAVLERVRETTVGATAFSGLAGVPEVTLPAATVTVPDGAAPVGLSLVGGFGRDRALLALAREAAGLLRLP